MSEETVLGLSTISKRNQTTIPKRVRSDLNLKEGDQVLWIKETNKGKVYVRKA